MASPGLIRLSVAASVITTGAAGYYFLSEGGDSEKLQSNLRDTTEKVYQVLPAATDWAERVANTVLAPQPATLPASVPLAVEEEVPERQTQEARREASDPETERLPLKQTGAHCHTCSGPRIWFFAEKLRLKRRITPYPDPSQD